MTKAGIIGSEIESFLKEDGFWDFCRVKVKFSNIEVGFTKAFPASFKTLGDFKIYILDTIGECISAIGKEDQYGPIRYFESPMNVVTRDTELWNR